MGKSFVGLFMTSGTSFVMRCRLASLMKEHGVEVTPVALPLLPPTDHPMLISGIAATSDVDLSRIRIAPHAFGLVSPRRVKLLYRHDLGQVAGRIEDLRYDERGNLRISAVVTHDQARRCGAFSVGASVLDYTILDAGTDRFCALVTSAELEEVSLTPTPANPCCLVTSRCPASETYSLIVANLQRLTKTLEMRL